MTKESLFAPVSQGPLRDIICDQLLDLIVSGGLAPGSRLVEADLAESLGTSRVPVREALLELSKDGWVDLRARQGAWVHVPQEAEVGEVFEVRAALEAEAARLAAIRAEPGQAEQLRAYVDSGVAAVRAQDFATVTAINKAFHHSVTELSGNALLASLLGGLERRVQWYFRQVASVRGMASWEEHSAIVDAIMASEPAKASDLMRAHIARTCEACIRWRQGDQAGSPPSPARKAPSRSGG
jgi:DNA-binding GntR family transcriptional regulator